MEDIQLAMVIARLYESDFETSSTYISILNQKILGCQKDGSGFDCRRLHPDPFLRSLAYWVMKDYTRALDTLLEQTPKEDDEQQGRHFTDFSFSFLKEDRRDLLLPCPSCPGSYLFSRNKDFACLRTHVCMRARAHTHAHTTDSELMFT